MLFIYRVLPIGGVETFFLRIAKERNRLGKHTSILLLSGPKESNQELLSEFRRYAQVLFLSDIFWEIPFIGRYIPLLLWPKLSKLKARLSEVDQIHVFHGIHAMLGYRLVGLLGRELFITVGFYHYIRYLWGEGGVAFHEQVNRKFIFDYLPEQSLMFFSEGSRELYRERKGKAFEKSNTFSLGVVDKNDIKVAGKLGVPVKIVAVGRLVEFKTYNIYMVGVVRELRERGIDVVMDIYGDGPLRAEVVKEIVSKGCEDVVRLCGSFDYSKFDNIVAQYDLFIGSGTAIIQASSLGIPSIVGVENVITPKTYGYFCDVKDLQYTRKGLNVPLRSVPDMIAEFVSMDDPQRMKLKECHLSSVSRFTVESCQHSMDMLATVSMPKERFRYPVILYTFSYLLDMINRRFNKNHPRNRQFDDFRNIVEKS